MEEICGIYKGKKYFLIITGDDDEYQYDIIAQNDNGIIDSETYEFSGEPNLKELIGYIEEDPLYKNQFKNAKKITNPEEQEAIKKLAYEINIDDEEYQPD